NAVVDAFDLDEFRTEQVELNVELSAGAVHRVGGVREQVHEHLRELARDAAYERQLFRKLLLYGDVALGKFVLAEHERLVDDFAERHGARNVRSWPRVGHEIARKLED